jgi:hypothetical protein
MENCCLLITANESYQMAEKDWKNLRDQNFSQYITKISQETRI